ncbi:hypothetical protein ASZ78_003343, partial [Callipepla squamata]
TLTVSIFLLLPGVTSLGGSTTICCRCLCHVGNTMLHKDGYQLHTMELHGCTAEFSTSNATKMDRAWSGGDDHHLCLSQVLELQKPSGSWHYVKVLQNFSCPLPTEFHLHKPVLSVLPGREVSAGVDMMLHCTIKHSKAVCFLYLEGQATVFNISVENTDFSLSWVDHSKGGHYNCQWYNMGTLNNWSGVSNMLELVVE